MAQIGNRLMWTPARLRMATLLDADGAQLRKIASTVHMSFEAVALYLYGGIQTNKFEFPIGPAHDVAPVDARPESAAPRSDLPAPEPSAPAESRLTEPAASVPSGKSAGGAAPPAAPVFHLVNRDGAYVRKNGMGITYGPELAWVGNESQAREVLKRPIARGFSMVPA